MSKRVKIVSSTCHRSTNYFSVSLLRHGKAHATSSENKLYFDIFRLKSSTFKLQSETRT